MAKTNLTRRRFLQLTGSAVGLSALAACVPAAPAPATDTGSAGGAAPAAEPGSLWVLHKQDFHPEYNEFIRQHIVSFAEEKGLQLDVAYTAGFAGTGADIQKVAAAVQAGEPPDVWIDNINPFQLHQLGTLQPVTDLQQEVSAKYGEPNPRPKAETFLDGEYVGVTLHCRSDGGWARRDLFEAANIDLASMRTYEELRDAALAVSDPANEMWGWGMTVNRSGDGGYLITRVLHGWGATWVDETGQKVTIDSPEAVAAVEWLVDLYTNPQWEPMLPPGVLSWTDTSNNEAYLGGKIAYTQNAGTVYAKAVADGLEIADLTMYDVPKGGPVLQDFNGLGGMYLHLIKGAKNPQAAQELILSFFEEDVMKGIYSNAVAYAVPGYSTMWDWEEIAGNPISTALKDTALDPSGWTGLAWPGPSTAQIGAVANSNIHTDMVANVINGQMTAAEAVKDAAERSIQIFKEFGAAGE
ncbi:extracellular solute-binding protein [Litorilinea aerophila]|uniref:Extracellular solute-binding protein n=1 Tax=Litorilinea aerophila TaxID=1204385 RepID=A0A540VDB5_9CHLR|nr:extracellular solute-binding protein [Litorilinea aerophila]MCC9077453.1 extracellular solute-binding protein [Litorilinea aerophila]GIV77579.1 MAG: ABC transporter substrate-binding protein [Litorilinea sp.]